MSLPTDKQFNARNISQGLKKKYNVTECQRAAFITDMDCVTGEMFMQLY